MIDWARPCALCSRRARSRWLERSRISRCGAPLGSAGLNVFMNAPDADPRFAALPHVVLYPHHASGTVETRDKLSQLVLDNLAAHFAGRPLLTPVN